MSGWPITAMRSSRDDDFAHLYADGKGRPSIPPSVMIRAMLCATHDRTPSDRGDVAADPGGRRTGRRPWASTTDFEGIAATTFTLMRARMVAS